MIDKVHRAFPRHWLLPVALSLGRMGLTPNALSFVGLTLSLAAALLVASGSLLAGGLMILVAGAFDMLDGQLARATQRATTFGAFLDSTLDRVDEALVLISLTYFYLLEGATTEVMLTMVTLEGSLMVSYVKARAEGLGLRCDVGWFQRPERVVFLSAALVMGGLGLPYAVTLVLWLLAVITNITAAQRVWHIWLQTDRGRP